MMYLKIHDNCTSYLTKLTVPHIMSGPAPFWNLYTLTPLSAVNAQEWKNAFTRADMNNLASLI